MNSDTVNPVHSSLLPAFNYKAEVMHEIEKGLNASAVTLLEILIEQAYVQGASDT